MHPLVYACGIRTAMEMVAWKEGEGGQDLGEGADSLLPPWRTAFDP